QRIVNLGNRVECFAGDVPEFVAVVVIQAQEFDGECPRGIAHAEALLVGGKTIVEPALGLAAEGIERRGGNFLVNDREKLSGKILLFDGIEAMSSGSGLEILSRNGIVLVLCGAKETHHGAARRFTAQGIGGGWSYRFRFCGGLRSQTRDLCRAAQ